MSRIGTFSALCLLHAVIVIPGFAQTATSITSPLVLQDSLGNLFGNVLDVGVENLGAIKVPFELNTSVFLLQVDINQLVTGVAFYNHVYFAGPNCSGQPYIESTNAGPLFSQSEVVGSLVYVEDTDFDPQYVAVASGSLQGPANCSNFSTSQTIYGRPGTLLLNFLAQWTPPFSITPAPSGTGHGKKK